MVCRNDKGIFESLIFEAYCQTEKATYAAEQNILTILLRGTLTIIHKKCRRNIAVTSRNRLCLIYNVHVCVMITETLKQYDR